MAWTAPTTWTVGQTVTAADMNAQLGRNLDHVGGILGFTATPATSGHGIEPLGGYFAGAHEVNHTIDAGLVITSAGGTTGTAFSFTAAFTSGPAVVGCIYTTSGAGSTDIVTITAISSTGGSINAQNAHRVYWMAWGSST